MQTDTIQAWQVETDDVLFVFPETVVSVTDIRDEFGLITVTARDDEGIEQTFDFDVNETVTIVTAMDD